MRILLDQLLAFVSLLGQLWLKLENLCLVKCWFVIELVLGWLQRPLILLLKHFNLFIQLFIAIFHITNLHIVLLNDVFQLFNPILYFFPFLSLFFYSLFEPYNLFVLFIASVDCLCLNLFFQRDYSGGLLLHFRLKFFYLIQFGKVLLAQRLNVFLDVLQFLRLEAQLRLEVFYYRKGRAVGVLRQGWG